MQASKCRPIISTHQMQVHVQQVQAVRTTLPQTVTGLASHSCPWANPEPDKQTRRKKCFSVVGGMESIITLHLQVKEVFACVYYVVIHCRTTNLCFFA